MNGRRKGRLMFVFLVAIFALPVAIVWALYTTDWRPGGKSHGELLQPPRMLHLSALQTAQQKQFPVEDWHGKWHLVYVADGACGQECRDHLHMMRQLHASLGKEMGRLQRVWLLAGALPEQDILNVQGQYPDMVVLPEAAALAGQFDLPGNPAGSGGQLYLVDPLGQLMMSYPRDAAPAGIRKDLMRLLSYSWTG